jgi:hypothetical protein
MMGLFLWLETAEILDKKNLRLWGKSEIEIGDIYYSER